MGFKGLLRDILMFGIGIALLFNWLDKFTAAIVLIVFSVLFTIIAWLRFFKGF